MNESNRRARRVAQAVRDCVARFLVAQAADTRLASLIITEVRMSDDLSVAHLAFRYLEGTPGEIEQRQTLKQLQLLGGRLRRQLGPQLGLRRVPELRFAFDAGLDARHRVEQLLEEIRTESSK